MFDYDKYLRLEMFPHIWCPGCGCGIVMKSLIRAIDRLGLQKDEVCMVSGIGCSSRLTGYVDFNTLHTTHGRPIAFATGVKLAKPSLSVIVVTGDGDALAIGGNHFIHAARRNIDLTVLLFNNATYGMTGGQLAPTTPTGKVASTARQGSIDPPFDACRLAIAAGATYVARGTSYHTQQLDRLIEGGHQAQGLCPGRDPGELQHLLRPPQQDRPARPAPVGEEQHGEHQGGGTHDRRNNWKERS